MTRMVGTGKAPQGYMKDQMFDVPEHDQGTVEDLERKGWAKRVDPRDDVGHSVVGVANALVRGDMLSHPVDAAIAEEIGGHDAALPIVHSGDPDAGPGDYDAEVAAGKRDFYGDAIEGDASYGHVPSAASSEKKDVAKAKSSKASKASAAKADDSKADDKKADDKAADTSDKTSGSK